MALHCLYLTHRSISAFWSISWRTQMSVRRTLLQSMKAVMPLKIWRPSSAAPLPTTSRLTTLWVWSECGPTRPANWAASVCSSQSLLNVSSHLPFYILQFYSSNHSPRNGCHYSSSCCSKPHMLLFVHWMQKEILKNSHLIFHSACLNFWDEIYL